MHGHHGWGHIGRGIGHGFGRGFGGGWGRGFGGGWGLGWIFPAWIIGQAISQAFDRPADPEPPSNWPPVPAAPFPIQTPAAKQPAAAATTVTCRYCGQKLQTEGGLCVHCGAPQR
jgi:hypothetical protein